MIDKHGFGDAMVAWGCKWLLCMVTTIQLAISTSKLPYVLAGKSGLQDIFNQQKSTHGNWHTQTWEKK